MDAHTLSALELPKVLEYLAGFAVSESGRQACLALRPGNNLEEIRAQAALFEQGRLWAQKSALPLLPFIALDDLLRYAERPTAVLDLEALWEVRRMLIQAKELRLDILAGERENAWPLWLDRCRRTPLPDKSLSALSRCLSEEGLLRDEASPELFRLREELRGLHRQCLRKARDLAAEYNILHYIQDDFLTLASDRYVLPLKANFQGRLRGIIHDYSRTGETCYFEPLFLVQINNRIQELKREERKEEGRILAFLSDLARDELPAIRACRDFLVDVDLLKARHSLALCYDGRLVLLEADGGVLLREARHPLLALASSASAVRALAALRRSGQADGQEDRLAAPDPLPDPLGAVPVTLELPPGRQALIISGGNAGGKTVALKTLGLTALMTLCALPVPAQAGSRLPPWRRLHAFIGDGQSLDEHVSTFTAQIAHLARIWPGLGPDALILLDEFGAGTDPAQGAALARAVLETAMDHGALVCAATHFPALKAYALSDGRVRAASVLFDPATRRPLFRLAYDQVGSSQALEVAREHGLPEEILARAEADLLPGGEEAADLLDRLNSLAALRETEVDALARQRRSLEQERQGMLEEAAREKERLSASIQAESRQILASWQAARLSHKQALRELSRLRSALAAPAREDAEKEPSAGLDLAALRARQQVRHIPWKRVGAVLEVDARKNRVRLDLDGVSLWADAADLAPAEAVPDRPQSGFSGAAAGLNFPLHLDLRGFRADVALEELQKFLDGAILAGRSDLEVIHGRGTGALRRELHAFLRTFPPVASFRLAPEDRGGDGMTIVELK